MSIVHRHAEINMRWGSLPAATTVASFNFFDQCIVFPSYTEDDVQSIYREKTPRRIFDNVGKLYLAAYHEYRHWVDLTSTTYGLNWLTRLLTLSEIRDADINYDVVQRTCRLISQFAAEIHLPEYYSVLESLHDERPWQYGATVGRAFNTQGKISDDHPIWFLRFRDNQGREIARQPISVSSLLETRAEESELSVIGKILLSSKIAKGEDRKEIMHEFEQSMVNRIYSPELTLYSAAAHWYANNRRNPDIADAYLGASRLAEFCLNAPTDWISTLHPTEYFKKSMGGEAARLMHKSLLRKDRAALFFMLAHDKRLIAYEELDTQLDEVLSEWGTSVSALRSAATKERRKMLASLRSKVQEPLCAFLDVLDFNQKANAHNLEIQHYTNLQLPAIFLCEDVLFNIFTFKTREAAIVQNIFDPRSYAKIFGEIEETVYANRQYTKYEPHCFAEN